MRLAIVQDDKLQNEVLQTEKYRKNHYVNSRHGVFTDDLSVADKNFVSFLPKRGCVVYPEKELIKSLRFE